LSLLASLLVLFFMCGCEKYPGRARVSDAEVSGAYRTHLNTGKEDLTLNPDKTFVQVFVSPARNLTIRGRWKSSNLFLGATEIELAGAVCTEDEPSIPPAHDCDLTLIVHREAGRLRLARNEAADWYYDRK
jgi:hypothetical protein